LERAPALAWLTRKAPWTLSMISTIVASVRRSTLGASALRRPPLGLDWRSMAVNMAGVLANKGTNGNLLFVRSVQRRDYPNRVSPQRPVRSR